MMSTGLITGSVILKKIFQNEAPSISAASIRLRSTFDSAASRIRNMKGVHCHTSHTRIAG